MEGLEILQEASQRGAKSHGCPCCSYGEEEVGGPWSEVKGSPGPRGMNEEGTSPTVGCHLTGQESELKSPRRHDTCYQDFE